MSAEADHEFDRWVVEATRGLPPEAVAQARAELVAHYEDARDAYRSQACSPDEAHARTLADLGDARTVRRMLRRVHLSSVDRLLAGMLAALQALWVQRDRLGPLGFGLCVLVVTLLDHNHMVQMRGHADPVVTVALLLVGAGLAVERRLASWSYPAFGYLLAGIWGWLLAGPWAYGRARFWTTAAPVVVPAAVFALLTLLAVRRDRSRGSVRVPRAGWLLICLLLGPIVAEGVGYPGAPGRDALTALPLALLYTLLFGAPLVLPVFVGLLGARRSGLLAGTISLGVSYGVFVALVDPAYHLAPYAYWDPKPPLTLVLVLVRVLPPLAAFLVTPWWLLAAKSERGRIAALLVPSGLLLVLTPVLSAVGLSQPYAAFTPADWLRYEQTAVRFVCTVLLAVVLYRQFEGHAPPYIADGEHPARSVFGTREGRTGYP